jgi:hypothetical protein
MGLATLGQKHITAKGLFFAGALMALPLAEACPNSADTVDTTESVRVRLIPKNWENDTPEQIKKRWESETITILYPPEYVRQNRATVDSMKKAAEEAQRKIETIISTAQEMKNIEATSATSAAQARYIKEIETWLKRRAEAFELMLSIFPETLKNDYGARKGQVALEPPAGIGLGIYHEYVRKSIGIACVFFYKEGWKGRADAVAACVDWAKVRSNIDVMIAMRDGINARPAKEAIISSRIIRPNLSDQYLAMVAVLADVMEQLTGVDRNVLLAIGTMESSMDHNNFNRKTRDRSIMQLNKNNPLFSYVAFDRPSWRARMELENVMHAVLPEKKSFENARTMMAGLWNAIDIRGEDQQGDITMAIMAGALTYRYKHYMKTGRGRLDFSGCPPYPVSYDRGAAEDYNGSEIKKRYAKAVGRCWLKFKRASDIAVRDGGLPVLD